MSKFLTVGDVCNITTGSLDSNAFVENGKYPFYTCAKEPTNIDTYAFDDDVVLVAGNNAQGNFHVNRFKGKFNAYQRTYILTSKGEKSIDYIYYLLSLALKLLKDKSQGSQTKFLTIGILKEIHVPNLANSQIVAKVLSDLDAKIELNNRINTELEAMAKTLYDYWFVQFEFPFDFAQGKPNVPGVVAERSRGYKSSGGKMVYNAELKREIPEGWEVKELSEICSFISRGISPVYLDEGGICVLNQKCIRNRTVLYDEARRNDNNIRNAEAKRILKYDVLVNSTGVGTLGRVAVVNRLAEDFVTVDSHVTIVRANTELINKFYFGFTLLEKQKEIEGFSNGSTGQVELSRSQLESLKLIVPANEIQVKFEKIYKNCLDKMAINLEQNQHLASLRDWLLPMLMNGQVTVRQAHGNTVKEAEERLSSSTERSLSEVEVSRSMAAEPVEKYTPKGNEH